VQRCRFDRPLGPGAFATVFLVTCANRRCALKQFNVLLFGTLDVGMLQQQLLAEVRTLLHVQHRNVVKRHGFFLWDPQCPQVQPCSLLELMERLGSTRVRLFHVVAIN
jgi:hypothetical protein